MSSRLTVESCVHHFSSSDTTFSEPKAIVLREAWSTMCRLRDVVFSPRVRIDKDRVKTSVLQDAVQRLFGANKQTLLHVCWNDPSIDVLPLAQRLPRLEQLFCVVGAHYRLTSYSLYPPRAWATLTKLQLSFSIWENRKSQVMLTLAHDEFPNLQELGLFGAQCPKGTGTFLLKNQGLTTLALRWRRFNDEDFIPIMPLLLHLAVRPACLEHVLKNEQPQVSGIRLYLIPKCLLSLRTSILPELLTLQHSVNFLFTTKNAPALQSVIVHELTHRHITCTFNSHEEHGVLRKAAEICGKRGAVLKTHDNVVIDV